MTSAIFLMNVPANALRGTSAFVGVGPTQTTLFKTNSCLIFSFAVTPDPSAFPILENVKVNGLVQETILPLSLTALLFDAMVTPFTVKVTAGGGAGI